jgi:hypothetical protein
LVRKSCGMARFGWQDEAGSGLVCFGLDYLWFGKARRGKAGSG